MSATDLAMSVEEILSHWLSSNPAKHPTKSIQQHANKLTVEIYEKYKQFRTVVLPCFEDLVAHWKGMTRSERVTILLQAWPEMSRL
jgi:hypothetical protein